jgi:group I intron endonuclease
MKQSGIYTIENTVNGHVYVGSSSDYVTRRREHLYYLRHGKHHSAYLQRAFNKYGEEAFIFRLIEEVPRDRQLLLERETYWIRKLHAHYNASSVYATRLGTTVPEETRERIREGSRGNTSHLGFKHTPEAIEKIKIARAKQAVNESMLQNLAKGRAISAEQRKGMTGKRHSEATLKKMSESAHRRAPRIQTDEERHKRSESMKIAWQKRRANSP